MSAGVASDGLTLIAAVARNGVIGDGDGLLWHLPGDMQFFRRATMGRTVVMGRKTWDSLPARFRPLPGRRNVVVTRQPGWRAEGAIVAHSLDEALALTLAPATDTPQGIDQDTSTDGPVVIGGAQIYALAMPFADTLLLTEIDRDYEGTARFPDWPRDRFVEAARVPQAADTPGGPDYSFVTYRRVRPG